MAFLGAVNGECKVLCGLDLYLSILLRVSDLNSS